MIILFENMICSKKVKYLIRKYDMAVQKMNCSKTIGYMLWKYYFVIQKYENWTEH